VCADYDSIVTHNMHGHAPRSKESQNGTPLDLVIIKISFYKTFEDFFREKRGSNLYSYVVRARNLWFGMHLAPCPRVLLLSLQQFSLPVHTPPSASSQRTARTTRWT
jgi:hypothetical protein